MSRSLTRSRQFIAGPRCIAMLRLENSVFLVTAGLARSVSPNVDAFGGVTKSYTTGTRVIYFLQAGIASLPAVTGSSEPRVCTDQLRPPKIAVPTRTSVAPHSMAIS
jgi:hypothetical protein